MKKKTYVFDGETVRILEEIKVELGKKETQILKEAIRLYRQHQVEMRKEVTRLEKAVERIESLADRISDLSYKLGRCEERLRQIQEEIERLKSG